MSDEIKDEEIQENSDEREEETKDEIRDEDYREDDILEMLREFKQELGDIRGGLENVKTAISAFVDNGAVIRESDDSDDVDDFADDFVAIEDMNLSLDERR